MNPYSSTIFYSRVGKTGNYARFLRNIKIYVLIKTNLNFTEHRMRSQTVHIFN